MQTCATSKTGIPRFARFKEKQLKDGITDQVEENAVTFITFIALIERTIGLASCLINNATMYDLGRDHSRDREKNVSL